MSAQGSSSKVQTPADLVEGFRRETGASEETQYKFRVPQGGDPAGLSAFLDKHPPSTTKVTDTQAFVWVTVPHRRPKYTEEEEEAMEQAFARAQQELAELKVACDKIQADDNIPNKFSKAKGKSKAQRKKALTDTFVAQIVPTVVEEGGRPMQSGKWLFFKSLEYVDHAFRVLAESIAHGPLSRLEHPQVHTVKAALLDESRQNEANKKHKETMIALYFQNIWDADDARTVIECVLRNHSLFTRAAKSDLYTLLGIDSNHWSGIKSSAWNLDALVPKDRQEELEEEYRALKSEKQEQAKQTKKDGQTETQKSLTSKSFASKHQVEDKGGFESEEDEDAPSPVKATSTASPAKPTTSAAPPPVTPASAKKAPTSTPPKYAPLITKSTEINEDDDSDTEEEEEMSIAPRRSPVKKPSTAATAPAATSSSSSTAKRDLPSGFGSAAESAADMNKRRKALRKDGGF